MTATFRPAPGWPPPPPGWVPGPGWQPDPSWPPAPPGWQFWETPPDTGAPAVTAVPPAAAPSAAATPEPHVGWRERHAEKRTERDHQHALDAWQHEQDLLDALAGAAGAAATGGPGVDGLVTKAGECALWRSRAALIEPHRAAGSYHGGYSGVSLHVAKGVSYRVGGTRGHYVPGPEVQTPVDTGTVFVTTARVVFTGSRATREWDYDKLIAADASADDLVTLLHVSNRQKVSGISFPAPTRFPDYFALGVAIAQQGAAAVRDERARTAADHRAGKP